MIRKLINFLLKESNEVNVSSSRIDGDRFVVRTERGGEKKETIVVVFNQDEVRSIDEAKKNISKSSEEGVAAISR